MASPSFTDDLALPSVSLVHQLVDFYAQQQSWVSAQLAQAATPSPYAASPSPPPSSIRTITTTTTRPAQRRRNRLNIQTRLIYLPRHSTLLKHHHPRSTSSSPSARSTRTASPPEVGTTTSSTTAANMAAVLGPASVPSPSPGAMTLVAMYGDMIGERMQMCMRLEEMVRDAAERDHLSEY